MPVVFPQTATTARALENPVQGSVDPIVSVSAGIEHEVLPTHVATANDMLVLIWQALLYRNPFGHAPIGRPYEAKSTDVMTAVAPKAAQVRLSVVCSLTYPQIAAMDGWVNVRDSVGAAPSPTSRLTISGAGHRCGQPF